jgi:capsular exopolysaccharide synthesis family protein
MSTERAIQVSTGPTQPGGARKRTLRDLLYIIFSHKRKVLIFMVVLFGAVAVTTFLRPRIYRSEARLMVRLGRESVSLDPTATIGEIVNINRTYDWEVNAELEILKSREIAERVVDELGTNMVLKGTGQPKPVSGVLKGVDDTLHYLLRGPHELMVSLGLSQRLTDREKAVHKLVRGLKIAGLQNTSVIDLSYRERKPERAREVLEKFIQAYLDKHLAVYTTANSQEFFEQQVAQSHAKLAQAEQELQQIKDATGVSSLEEQRSMLVTTIGTMEQGMAQTEADLTAAVARVAGIQTALASVPEIVVVEETTGFPDYGTDLMRSRLYELRLAEKDLEAKYRPDSRQLDTIRKQVNEGAAILQDEQARPDRAEVKKGMNNTYQQIQLALLTEQSNVSALQSKLEKMRTQVTETKATLKMLNDVEIKTARLQREIKLLTDNYGRYFDKLEEARIDGALKNQRISNISILQAATTPVVPVGPRRGLHLAMGLFLALAGGVGFAFVCEHVDHTLKTPEDVQEKLRLPTLASIPRSRWNTVGPVLTRSQRKKLASAAPGQTAAIQWDIPINVRRHYTAFREQLLLGAAGSAQGHPVIGVTSCSRLEGVSTVAANLASCLSESGGGSVLLVDANTHHPSIHRIFRTRLSPGLVDLLATEAVSNGDGTIVHRAVNLSVLTAGSANGTTPKIINSDNLIKYLESTRQDYRFTVVDIPALSEDTSAIRLAGSCDGVVLVVETQRLRWETIERTKQQLQQHDVNVLGVLLNKRRFPVPHWIYAAL